MRKDAKILITGASGLVGTALRKELDSLGYQYASPTHQECDFEDRKATMGLFEKVGPEYVFHLANKVGGIAANMKDPVGFLHSNLLITAHVLEACHHFEVKKTVQLGSSCMYPKNCPQPMKEDQILEGPLEPTNEGYAIAKIAAMKLGHYYHSQYKRSMVCPIAGNIYGPGDHFDLEKSHVFSALVVKFCQAVMEGMKTVTLWGTGSSKRQFIHVQDVARGLLFFMENVETPEPINLGSSDELSIRELATLISKAADFQGHIEWDKTKPDGMPRKCLDIEKLTHLGFNTKVPIGDGVKEMIAEFHRRQPK